VLSRKLGRRTVADSLLWVVVLQYPATESQLAARDYLEQDGVAVPDSLIKLPPPPVPPPADTTRLTPPPRESAPLGRLAVADTARAGGRSGGVLGRTAPRRGFMRTGAAPRPLWDPRYAGLSSGAPGLAGDSPFTGSADEGAAGADSANAPGVRPPSPSGAAPDLLPVAPPGLPPGGPSGALRDSLRNRLDR
jgi:hypothetical protein